MPHCFHCHPASFLHLLVPIVLAIQHGSFHSPPQRLSTQAAKLLQGFPANACAFLFPGWHKNQPIELRSFGRSGEIQLCGHALMCAAHWLWQSDVRESVLHFYMPACKRNIFATQHGSNIQLALPANNHRLCPPPPRLESLLGQTLIRSAYSTSLSGTLIAELDGESAVRQVDVSAEALSALTTGYLLLTAKSNAPRIDVISRYFNPTGEDLATGSAHILVANWWRGRFGARPLQYLQASPTGGRLRAQHCGTKVQLWGKCSTL